MKGITVSNNVFDNVDDYAVWGDNQDSITVHGNYIDNLQNATNADGLYFFDIQYFEITGNTIFANDWGIYIADGNFDGPTVATPSLIANNMVLSPNDYGMRIDDVYDVNFYHNTVMGEPALYINDNLRMEVKNNIFASNGDFAFESADDLLTNITADYNMYWTPLANSLLVREGTTNYNDLVAWTGANAANNGNSIEAEPGFISPTDLHKSQVNGYDAGDNTVGITVDIDGDARPLAPSVSVDMGADEWSPGINDAGVASFDNLSTPVTPGLTNVEVSVENFGANLVDSVMIDWEINGAPQVGLNYTTAIVSATANANISLGSYNFPANGFTTLKAWTSMPNSIADTENNNDTLEISLCSALNCTYTIGGVASDFTDIQEAINVLNTSGVSGPTILNIQPGTYTGGYILTPITGASATNTITFDGGNVTSTFLTHDATGIEAVWSFQGAEYITLKNMDITNTGTTDAWGVHLKSQSNHNTVDGCVFNMYAVSGMSDVAAIVAGDDLTSITSEGDNGDSCTFSNNQINGGQYGIRLEGEPLIAEWTSNSVILNNTFTNVDDYGIYVDNQDYIIINGNVMSGFQNTIAADGIYCFDIQNFDISLNNIVAPDRGIYIADGNFDGPTVATPSLISNNMVATPLDYSLYIDDVYDVNIFHNTFYGLPAIRMNDNERLDIRNNIFVSNTDYAFESDDVFATTITIDYNIFWTPAANTLFAKEGTNIYANLAAWQGGVSATNTNSIEVEPLFVSATDLHRQNLAGGDLGDNSVGITVDIDGDARPLAPSTIVDMGADEYSIISDDAALIAIMTPLGVPCGDSSTTVSFIVSNFGENNITSLPVTLEVTGAVTETVNLTYSNTILSGTTDTFTVHLLNTYAGGVFNISGYTSLVGDLDPSNDTLSSTRTYIPFEPTAINNSICGVDSGTVYADSTYFPSFKWYDAPTGGNLVGNGSSFTIPSISTQNTYYVEYASYSDEIETTYNVSNGCSNGNMFDINATITTNIGRFCVNSSSTGIFSVNVYYIIGDSYLGNELNANAWTSAGQYIVQSAGTNNASCFDLTTPILIPEGQTVAIYLDYIANYGNLSTSYSNAAGNITISTGAGLCAPFSTVTPGRNFSGSVIFTTEACSAIRVPAYIPNTPIADLGPDTSSCNGSYTLSVDSLNANFDILWSNGDTTLTTTVTSTGTYSVEISDPVNSCMTSDTVVITIGTTSNDTIVLTACDVVNVMGVNQTTSGFITETLSNAAGCDSLIVYDITILNSSSSNFFTSLCLGESYLLADNSTVDTAGTYVVTLANNVGCDSIITTVIDMYALSNVSISGITPQVCDTAGLISVDLAPLGGTLSGNGITGTTFDPAVAGLGFTSLTYQVADSNGCDLTAFFDVEVIECIVGIRGISGIETINIYPNPYTNNLSIVFEDENSDELNITLIDALGRVITAELVQTTTGINTINMTLPNHAAGVTFIQFERNGKTYHQNLIKK